MDTFTEAYIVAALWSSIGDDDEPLDKKYSIRDISPETLQKIKKDCAKFQAENAADIASNLAEAGHDFWLTRNNHGCGFWDGDWENGEKLTEAANAFPECDLYVGDDGLIYS
jgi:hypothetical protein